MKINSMGINYTHGSRFMIERPKGSGDYLFLFIKTPAIFIIHNKTHYAEKNSLIIYKKGTEQKYFASGNSFSNDFIHFDINGDWELGQLPFDLLLQPPSVKPISKILKDIYLEYISNNEKKSESIDLLMKLLFVKIHELTISKMKDNTLYGYDDILLDLRTKIYLHPEVKWTIEKLAKLASLSPSYFQKLYTQTFCVTCMKDVINSKIEYAKSSLTSTDYSIKQISELCGYENDVHFMRQFKSITGDTPSKYRSKIKQY